MQKFITNNCCEKKRKTNNNIKITEKYLIEFIEYEKRANHVYENHIKENNC
jgi:hypothetical protein